MFPIDQHRIREAARLSIIFLAFGIMATWARRAGLGKRPACLHGSRSVLFLSCFFVLLGGQSALGAGHFALLAGYPAGGHAQGDGECFEGALGPVVVVVAADAVDMHGEARGLGEALQAVRHHLGAQAAEPLALEAEVDDAVRAVGQIDDGAAEGLVEGSVGVAEAGEAGGGSEGAEKSRAEGDAAVFSRVVIVN